MKKRFLATLLSVCLTLTLLPVNVLADDIVDDTTAVTAIWDGTIADSYAGGSGTSSDPYQIETAAQLAKLASDVNSGLYAENTYYTLTADIYLNDTNGYTDWETEAPANYWTPIGNESTAFKGTFYGNDHRIYGIYIDSNENYQGLFGNLDCAKIKGVGIVESFISGGNYVGGIAGYALMSSADTNIEDCYNKGIINGTDSVGGIIGEITHATIVIDGINVTNCYNEGNITGNGNVGGIAGHANMASMLSCYNVGEITGTGNRVGGIAGRGSYAWYCWNLGKVSGIYYVSGIIGGGYVEQAYVDAPSYSRCFNAGDISGSQYVGGISGHASSRWSFSSSTIDYCYNIGTVSATGNYVAGICPWAWHIYIKNCYNTGTVSGEAAEAYGAVGGETSGCNLENDYYLVNSCSTGGSKITGTVTEKTGEDMREADFVTALNNGASRWIADNNNYNSGYPILDEINYEVYASYLNTDDENNSQDQLNVGFSAERDGWCIVNHNVAFGQSSQDCIASKLWYDTYGIHLSSAIYSIKTASGWGGRCFGLSLLAAANYTKKFDLSQYFNMNTEDNTLAKYGYNEIVTYSGDDMAYLKSGQQYFSIVNNKELIAIIERAQISQCSKEIDAAEVFHNDSSYANLLEYLSQTVAEPIVAILNHGTSAAHAVVIDTSIKPYELKNNSGRYFVPLYDPNVPQSGDMLSNPSDWYTQEPSYLLLDTNSGRWEYWKYGVCQLSNSYKSLFDFTILFYDTIGLSNSFFNNSYLTLWWTDKYGNNRNSLSFTTNNLRLKDNTGNILLQIDNGQVTWIDQKCEFKSEIDASNNSAILCGRVSFPAEAYSYESDSANVVVWTEDTYYAISNSGTCTISINSDSKEIDLSCEGNSDFAVAVQENNEDEYDALLIEGTLSSNTISILPSSATDLTVTSTTELAVDVKMENSDSLISEYKALQAGEINYISIADQYIDLAKPVQRYTIMWDSNGGKGILTSDTATEGVPFILPTCGFDAPEGKEFKAWSIDDVEYAPGDTYTFTGDTTVTAVWQDAEEAPPAADTYTITFDPNGGDGAMEPVIVTENTPFTLPACTFTAPEGKEFKAWSIDGEEYVPGDTYTFTGDTTVTAVWQDAEEVPPVADTCTVIFDPNGGDGAMEPVTVTEGVPFTLPACTFTAPEGTEFKAWSIDGMECAPGDTYTFTGDTTVTAVWQDTEEVPPAADIYTITFDPNGGDGAMEPVTVTEGMPFTLPACDFTAPEGAEFKAWSIDGEEYAPGDTYIFTGNTTVTAVWQDAEEVPPVITTYTVTFDPNGGDGTMKPVTATEGTPFTLPACTFTAPEGKEFKAWKIDDVEYAPGDTYIFTGDTTVTAVWQDVEEVPPIADTRTVTLDPNGGAVKTDALTTDTDGKLSGLPTPTRKGYAFTGWYTAREGGTQVTTNTVFDADTTVYAHWTLVSSSGSTGGGTTPSAPTYAVTAPSNMKNGTVNINCKNASKGTSVTITVTPDEGYELDELTVTDKNGDALKLADKGDGRYIFTMPASRVTISASFTEITQENEPKPTEWSNPYIDVPDGVWYYDAVKYVTEHGLMGGANRADTFQPTMTTTRGMIMTILARMNGVNIEGGSVWYETGMEWAVANGVSDGTNPEKDITRQELITMLWRYAGEPAGSQSLSGYPDAAETAFWAADAMRWAVEHGVITHTGEGLLNPTGPATRMEVATILMRFCQDIAK